MNSRDDLVVNAILERFAEVMKTEEIVRFAGLDNEVATYDGKAWQAFLASLSPDQVLALANAWETMRGMTMAQELRSYLNAVSFSFLLDMTDRLARKESTNDRQ